MTSSSIGSTWSMQKVRKRDSPWFVVGPVGAGGCRASGCAPPPPLLRCSWMLACLGSHRLQVKPSLTSLFSREPWLSQVLSAAGMESATTNLPRRCSATQLPSSRWRRSLWFLSGPPLRRRHEPRRTATAAPPRNCRLPSRRWRHRFLPNEGSRLDLIWSVMASAA